MTELLTFLGIVLPSVLTAGAIRRWIEPVKWRTVSLFLVLTLIFLGGAVFTSKLPVPVDEVARGYPYRGIFGNVEPRNPLTSDTVKLFLPWMQVCREQLLHFRAPLWDPYSFSGYPLLANGESAPFSPLFLSTLFVPLPKQIVAMAGLKIFLALLFTFLCARREGSDEPGAFFAAVAYSFCGAMVVYLYYSAASVICLLPAAVFAVEKAMSNPSKRAAVFLAIVVATALADGHPESVFHLAIGCAVVILIDLAFGELPARRRAGIQHVFIGVFVGVLLSTPAWLPVLQQVRLSARYADLLRHSPWPALPHVAAFAILNPNGFGNPVRHDYAYWVNYSQIAFTYIGLITIALWLGGLFSREATARDRLFAIAALLLYLIAAGWTAVGRLVNQVPPFSLAANEKLRFVALFFVALGAGKALSRSRVGPAIAAIPIGASAIYIYVARRALLRPADLIGVLVLIAIFFLPRRFAPLLIATELSVFFAGFNALVDSRFFRPHLPIVEKLRELAPNEPYRIVGHDWTFLPNASAQYGLEDIRGSDPMALASYDAFLRGFTVQQNGTWVRRVVDVDRDELDQLNVRFLLAEPNFAASRKWLLRYRGSDGSLWENLRVQPRFRAAAAVIHARENGPDGFLIDVDARVPTVVTSSEPAAPGWRLIRSGVSLPVLRSGPFLSFEVPAGRSRLLLQYRPLSFYGGLIVSIVAFAAVSTWRERLGRERDSYFSRLRPLSKLLRNQISKLSTSSRIPLWPYVLHTRRRRHATPPKNSGERPNVVDVRCKPGILAEAAYEPVVRGY